MFIVTVFAVVALVKGSSDWSGDFVLKQVLVEDALSAFNKEKYF